MEEAFGLLQEMIFHLLAPDIVSLNAAISACEKGQNWEEASVLLQEMILQLLTLNVVS